MNNTNRHCKRCLRGYSHEPLDKFRIGDACACGGIIEYEPEFSELVDSLPERMTCARRMQDSGPWERKEGLDYWQQFKVGHRNRVCSFCGSLHFEDLQTIIQTIIVSDPDDLECGYAIETTDKDYKIYVRQPDVRNAHEGAIKFYMYHVPRRQDGTLDVTDQQNVDYVKAVNISNRRFEKVLYQR